MACFKIGDRVKRVRDPVMHPASMTLAPIGAEGTVVGFRAEFIVVDFGRCGEWGCFPYTLERLTPPKEVEDKWAKEKIEQLKKVAKEPIAPQPAEVARILDEATESRG